MLAATENQFDLIKLKVHIDKCKKKNHSQSHLLGLLHKIQELYGYLAPEVLDYLAQEMSVPTAHIWGIATFYHYFKLNPPGKFRISVCMGTTCYIKGAEEILNTIKERLNIDVGETTEDKLFTLLEARCLGACGLAPVIMVNEKTYGQITDSKAQDIIKKYTTQSKQEGLNE